jgi:hypothetical protein
MAKQYTYLNLFLKRFEHSRYHAKHRLLTWHPRGTFDDKLADLVVAVLETDETLGPVPFNRYTDFSLLTDSQLKMGHVFTLAERRRAAGETVRSAFFSDSTVGLGIARMYETLMAGAIIQVRAFPHRTGAAEWLNVPRDLLEPEV